MANIDDTPKEENVGGGDGGSGPQETTRALTDEEQAKIDAIKRRNMLVALIFGIVLLVLGFLAGQYAKQSKDGSSPYTSTVIAVCDSVQAVETVQGVQGAGCR
ncbi:MAG: hypothetical protein IKZ87_06670 [Actinomycetaceae bacterium]|nr:hypothetical protein [Actinomycetaceae bacterium]